jgi:hypothetical protein
MDTKWFLFGFDGRINRANQQSELEFVPHSAGPPPGPHVMREHE